MRKSLRGETMAHKLEMTPMIDVTFLLLVFFLCTLQFKTLDAKLAAHLPREGGAGDRLEPLERVTVALRVVDPGVRVPRSDGPGHDFDASRVVEYRVGPHRATGLAPLRDRLEHLCAADPERGVRIDAGPAIVAGEVVGVVDAVLAAGFTDLSFALRR